MKKYQCMIIKKQEELSASLLCKFDEILTEIKKENNVVTITKSEGNNLPPIQQWSEMIENISDMHCMIFPKQSNSEYVYIKHPTGCALDFSGVALLDEYKVLYVTIEGKSN